MRLLLLFLCFSPFLSAQSPTPAPEQKGAILILNATAHLGNGVSIPNSAVAFDQGKITLVGDATSIRIDPSKFTQIFQAAGKHVYPGFIALDTDLGLVEIEAVRSTRDNTEVGRFTPQNRSIVAYNTDSDILPTVRGMGVLMAQVCPSGGALSGTSSVVQLDAWNWEDAAYRMDEGQHLQWPARPGPSPAEPPSGQKPGEAYNKAVDDLRRYFEEARAYLQLRSPEQTNLGFEALRPLFAGQQRLYLHTSGAREIQDAVRFAESFGLKPVVVGAQDGWLAADFLTDHKTPVVLAKPQRLPVREDEEIDRPYRLPALLHGKGIALSLAEDGFWRQRNLPFQAGQAVAYGLPYEVAVSAITLQPARVLGCTGVRLSVHRSPLLPDRV